MQIVSDNDVIGAVNAIQLLIESPGWHGLAADVPITFTDFAALSLTPTSSDRDVWQACRRNDTVLITANREGGEDSLDAVIAELGDEQSLPVITIGNATRVVRDRTYAEDCAFLFAGSHRAHRRVAWNRPAVHSLSVKATRPAEPAILGAGRIEMSARIIDRGRGPELEGTRITVYRVMDYVRAGDPPERIRDELRITAEQVEAALDYIRSHAEEVNREYDRILDRIRQGNPEWVIAGSARTPEELKERLRKRRDEGAVNASGRR